MNDSNEKEVLRQRFEQFREDVATLENEISRVIVGQRSVIRGTLIAMIAGGHVLLEGVPGLGKTLLVRTISEVLDCEFARIQFTPDLMPADLTGTNILMEDSTGGRRFQFQPGPLFANIVLADEINRATPKTQAALLEAMQEHCVTVVGTTHTLQEPFFVLATQNPLEMEGTYPLPEAQLDRFFCKVVVPYPRQEEMVSILERTTADDRPKVEKQVPAEVIREMSQLARQIPVSDAMTRYCVRLVMATHPDHEEAPASVRQFVRFGSSPRGAQSLMLAAKINAVLDARFHVSEEDLAEVAPMVMRHRLILNFEGQAEDISLDQIIGDVFAGVELSPV